MILYPTIELRDDITAEALREQAALLYRLGLRQFYFIDRNAQYSDRPFALDAARAFMESLPDCEHWIGGGIRDLATVAALAETSASRIVVGPMLWEQPGLFAAAVRAAPGRLVALVAARQGTIDTLQSEAGALDDKTQPRRSALDQALTFESEGARGIMYLERDRAGFYGGIDAEIMADLAFALHVPLYVTGGINSLNDIRALKLESNTGIAGLVLGRALLDGRIDPVSALALLNTPLLNAH